MVLEAAIGQKQIRVASVVLIDTAVCFPQFLLDDLQGNFGLHGATVAVVADRSEHQSHQIQHVVEQPFGIAEVSGVFLGGRIRLSVGIIVFV